MLNLKKTKAQADISLEWDAIAQLREDQVSSGVDHSANHVLAPAIVRELEQVSSLVDIGCGTGWLTERVDKYSNLTVGVDPSEASISIARDLHKGRGIEYYGETIEDFALRGIKFNAAISNMSVSSAPDLELFMSAARKILELNANFVFTAPHPFFWPMYWGYISDPNFKFLFNCT